MQLEDHERRITNLERQIKAFSDAMNVQGILQWRTDRNLFELTEDVRQLTEDVRGLHEAMGALQQGMGTMQQAISSLADSQAVTQAALQALIAQMDRFLRGQSGNGRQGET